MIFILSEMNIHIKTLFHFTAQWQIVFQGKFILQSVFYYTF